MIFTFKLTQQHDSIELNMSWEHTQFVRKVPQVNCVIGSTGASEYPPFYKMIHTA